MFFNWKRVNQLRCDCCICCFSCYCVKIPYKGHLRKEWRKYFFWPRFQACIHHGWQVMASGVWGSWLRRIPGHEADTDEGCCSGLSEFSPLYSAKDPQSMEGWFPLSGWIFIAQLNLPGNTLVDTTTGVCMFMVIPNPDMVMMVSHHNCLGVEPII